MTSLNNVVVQLFDLIEAKSGVTFATFTNSETTPTANTPTSDTPQTYMDTYIDTLDTEEYKYLYDPDLAFDFRFHQRIATMTYADRENPWVTILFNTGQVRPLTNVLSHKYRGIEVDEANTKYYAYDFRRVSVPVNMVLVSNQLTYLYGVMERIALYFDRIINFKYNEKVVYSDTYNKTYILSGLAKNIHQVDLTKLDTENRGDIATAAIYFDLIYYVVHTEYTGGLLEEVITELRVKDSSEPITMYITQ